MYLLYAPEQKFGKLPQKTALITEEVSFTNNVAYCTKYYWYKHHILQGCKDITPSVLKRLRKDRILPNILFIVTGGIGDALWSMPFMKAVREKNPRSKILVAADERVMPIFLGVPYADICVKNEYWNLQNLIRTANEVYDFSGIATLMKKEMKLDPIDATFLDGEYPRPKERKDCRPKLVVTLDEGKQIEALLKRKGVNLQTDKLITLALEASTPNRNWPYSYARELTAKLIKDNYKVIWLSESKDFGNTFFYNCKCGYEFNLTSKDLPEKFIWQCPACKSQNALDEIKQPEGVINIAGQTDLRQAITITAMSDVFVGPNSGLMVIATALGIPTLGLFGAFNPKIRTKYYDRFAYIWGKVECSPCKEHWTECPNGHPAPCMKIITVEMVYEKIKALLEKYPRRTIERIPIE
jgi:ADP-heptose:LPS heptosyltransferase